MVLVIDDLVAQPTSQEIVSEFERQTKLRLPNSYRDFLLRHNGGHPLPDYIDLPPIDEFPAQIQTFYGLDADEWHYNDAWTTFKFFDTWIPFGLLMFGALTLEYSELCFDFRKYPGTSIHSRFRRFLFGTELLDPATENIPVKYFDWRHFNETREFRERDLYPAAASFEELVGNLRTLTLAESAMIEEAMINLSIPKPTPEELAQAQRELAAMNLKRKDRQAEDIRPPRLADLVQKNLAERAD